MFKDQTLEKLPRACCWYSEPDTEVRYDMKAIAAMIATTICKPRMPGESR